MQIFLVLRGAIFAELGFCLNAPALKKTSSAYFIMRSADGTQRGCDQIPGCSGDDPTGAVAVPLQSYTDERAARAALMVMCNSLADAVAGDPQAREALAAAWLQLITQGLRLTQQTENMQLELLQNLFGHGRIRDELNTRGSLQFFEMPSFLEMLNEALPIQAAA